MFRNYFIIALRKINRNRLFSFINIAGLGIGISAALVIYLVVQHEFNYEKFQNDRDRIYRVTTDLCFSDGTLFPNSGVPMPMPATVRSEVPGLEMVTHFITANEAKVEVPFVGSESPAVFKKQNQIIYADEFYFRMFTYEWVAGSRQTSLKDPFQVVLTETKAKTYFGEMKPQDIIGRTIIYDDSIKTTVAGVVKDNASRTTDFQFTEFISLSTAQTTGLKYHHGGDEWGSINSSSQMFVKLDGATLAQQVEAQLPALRSRHAKTPAGEKDGMENHLQTLTDLHFNPMYDVFGRRQGSRSTMLGLLAVAIFLLLLGCINFVNLTTAQSALRAKEIGIRKTAGSTKGQLIMQFLSETFILTLAATILSVVMVPWLLNIFSDFIPPEVDFSSLNQPHVWIFLGVLTVAVTFLSGFYPAWVLTKFQPVTVLKSPGFTGKSGTGKPWIRKTLTVTQFVIAQFLIIASFVVSKQIQFSMAKDLGYKKDAIVYFQVPFNFFDEKKDDRRFRLVEKLRLIPELEKVSLGGSPPASNGMSTSDLKVDNGKKLVQMMVEMKYGGENYFDIYQLKLIAGRWLQPSDTVKEYLINETYAKSLGLEDPLKAVGLFVDRGKKIPIVGVIGDFNTTSTHTAIKPLAYSFETENNYVVHLSLKERGDQPDLWKQGLDKVEKEFSQLYPGEELEFTFFDESIATFYKKEQDISRLLKWASGLCIFISCLGLMGLVIYITNTRTKEIGVRKVLGASITQIVTLLSKDFVKVVLVAFFIALPLAWWAMHTWLIDFAYRTRLSWWIFAISGAGMLLLAIIILSARTIRSASANPVKSLRSE
ncbi:MAG: ABC transporter permease [Chitinophagaceae bacterium]|nr:ABC transporter permease [Chitinophagaceae bacterium]